MTKAELTTAAQTFVDALNKVLEDHVAAGRKPLYKRFGFEVGSKHARVFHIDGGDFRSAAAFVSSDGFIRRSDSWKKPGRILGALDCPKALAYVAGPILS